MVDATPQPSKRLDVPDQCGWVLLTGTHIVKVLEEGWYPSVELTYHVGHVDRRRVVDNKRTQKGCQQEAAAFESRVGARLRQAAPAALGCRLRHPTRVARLGRERHPELLQVSCTHRSNSGPES